MSNPLRRAVAAAALLAALGLTACNTVAGAGQDVGSAGHGITNGANAVKGSL